MFWDFFHEYCLHHYSFLFSLNSSCVPLVLFQILDLLLLCVCVCVYVREGGEEEREGKREGVRKGGRERHRERKYTHTTYWVHLEMPNCSCGWSVGTGNPSRDLFPGENSFILPISAAIDCLLALNLLVGS